MRRAANVRVPVLAGVTALALLWAPQVFADLKKALAEQDLEKRSSLALVNAVDAFNAARKAYDAGDMKQVEAAAGEIQASVDLAATSLKDTGKNPRKHPTYFKRAEITTRDLLRKLDSFQQQMSYIDRPVLDAVRVRVQQAHDELLVGLLEGKK